MSKLFFQASNNARVQLTKLFDFVWPTAAAMWNLRWQVNGFLSAVPDATVDQLRARFAEGTDIIGANLKRACIEHTWEQQKESFGRILLVNSIAIYEGWLEVTLSTLGPAFAIYAKALQFPDSAAQKGQGAVWAIRKITSTESQILLSCLYPSLCANQHYDLPRLDAMLRCYRFFKELRNCEMHGGGIADQRLFDAYTNFAAVATQAALGMPEVPAHSAAVIGRNVNVKLRGLVGFSHLVLKLIQTLDAELARSSSAEGVFIEKWRAKYPKVLDFRDKVALPKSLTQKVLTHANFPKATNPDAFAKWLQKRGLCRFRTH